MVVLDNFENAAKRYGYNIKGLYDDITKDSRDYFQIERKMDRLEKQQLSGLLGMMGHGMAIREARKTPLEYKKRALISRWQEKWGASPPYVLGDNGKTSHCRILTERMEKEGVKGDGWYHIPDNLCQTGSSLKQKRDYEKQCKESGLGIPEKIGRALEDIFREAQRNGDTLWIHRTGLSQKAGLLADIAKQGLIVNSQGARDHEEVHLSYTATELSRDHFPYMLKNIVFETYKGCQGIVICRTSGTPVIENHRLMPEQIVGYVGRDAQGRVNVFLPREEMEQIHDKKEVMINGTVMEVERKNQNDMQRSDYYSIKSELFEKPLTFIHDCVDPDLQMDSVSYDGICYGNAEQMSCQLGLSAEQRYELYLCSQEAIMEFGGKPCREPEAALWTGIHQLDENGRLLQTEEEKGRQTQSDLDNMPDKYFRSEEELELAI